MKRIMWAWLIGILVLFSVAFSFGQDASLSIGSKESSETTPNSGVYNMMSAPVAIFYGYSVSQTIYTKEELQKLSNKQITALSYTFFSAPTKDFNHTVEVYIGYTDLNEFPGDPNLHFLSVGAMTKVAAIQGVNYKGQTVLTLPLSSPFFYDGTKNLVVCVSAPVKSSAWENKEFYATDTSSLNRCLLFKQDNISFTDPSSIASDKINRGRMRANTTFTYREAPTTPEAKLSLSTLDFGWTEVGSEPITKVLNVSNVGGGTLTLSNIDNLAPPFTLQETLSTISLGIGQSVDLHFVFTPTTSQEYSQSVIFKSNGSDKTLTLQAYAYKQGSLLETFEESSSIPNLFRVRTNNWKIAKQGAYQGDNFLQSTSTDMDTLIGPKVNKGNLIFFLKDGNYSSKDLQILYSTDLQNYTVLKTLADLQYNTQSYTKNTIDLSTLPSNAFIAIAGYRFNIDNILLTDPIRPSHDLYLASSNIPSSYNERTDVPISVEVKNWGSTKENSIQLQLLNQNGEVLKDTTFSENINAKDSLNLKFYWGPVPSTKELYIKAILALDEDLTNNISNKQKINVTPYIGVLKISPNTLNFDLLMANKESDTLSFTIQNTGIAPVEISRVKIKAPFSVLESNFTIEPKSSKTLKVLFSQAMPKSYKDSLVLVQNGLGDSIVILSGNIQREGDLFESFENGEFPPFLWRQTSSLKNKWNAYNSSSHAYRGDYSAYQNNTQEFDTLITPKLHIESGDKLSFYAKHWSNDACVLSVIYSADLKNWQLLHTYEGADGNGELQRTIQNYSIENLPQGNFFIAFVGKAEPMIDYIQGPAVIYPQKDLKVVSTIMPKECNRNMEIQVQAVIQNIGKQTAKNYTVQLKQNQTILAQIEGDSLGFLKTKTIEIPFVPLEVGNLQGIYVEVNLIGDEDSVNNKGTIGNILVRDEFYGEVQVGTTTTTSSNGAWSTNWKYTLNEILYYPEELGIKKGTVIKSIAFAHMPNAQEHRYPIKIWLGETDSMSLKSFWIDASALKQVVQDTVQIKSEGDPTYLSLDLGRGYTYQGKNLVVLLEKGHSAYTSFSFYTNESTHLDRKRSYYQDGSYIYYDTAKPIPYTEKQTSSEYPSIRLSIDRPSVYVTGTIQNEAKQNVEKAVVSLTNGKVVYIDTTDASGKFLIKTSLTGRAYVLDVKAPEYKFTPRTISIGDTNQDLGIITLPANLYTYSVFVWGRPVGAPLKDAVIKLKSQTTTEEFSQSLTSVCDTAIVTFPGLAKGLYTISLKHRDYAHYTQTDIPIYKEESDTIFLQGKEPIKVRGRVLSSIDHSPLQGVAVDFTCSSEKLTYKDTTDRNGIYEFTLSKIDRFYSITLDRISYNKYTDSVKIPDTTGVIDFGDLTMSLSNIILSLQITTSDGKSAENAVAKMVLNKDTTHFYQANALSNGLVILDNLLPGIYTLQVAKDGYTSYIDTALNVLQTKQVGIELKANIVINSLTVKVTTDNGQRIQGANLYLENKYTGLSYNEVLDSSGIKTFNQMVGGTYLLEIYKEGYIKYIDTALTVVGSVVEEIVLHENKIPPYALKAEVKYNQQNAQADIVFGWNDIGDYYFDSYESYDDFSIDFKPWTLMDLDQKGTASVSNVDYPHMGAPIAAMVFNPFTTKPVCSNESLFPFSGNKYMAFFGAVGAANDDWAIAPKRRIRNGDVVNFSIRQLSASSSKERYTVGVSVKDTLVSNFTIISQGNYLEIGPQWGVFQADLTPYAGEEVYIGIHCISANTGNMLMVDDFYIGAKPEVGSKASPMGEFLLASSKDTQQLFKIYLDGVLVDSTTKTTYTVTNATVGMHTLGVSAMYKSGESSRSEIKTEVKDYAALSAKFTLNLTTNTTESANKAEVTLINKEGIVFSYEVNNGKVEVNFLPKDTYILHINQDGFDNITDTIYFKKDTVLSLELKESIKAPVNPYVEVIKNADGLTSQAIFTWNENIGFNENFENYANFTQNLPPWKNLDLDKYVNFGLSSCTFPGAQKASAGIVFNPSATTPSIYADLASRPHSGNKYIIFISTDQGNPNDYLISPQALIRDGYILRFYAKSYSNVYGLENLNIKISETDTSISSFKILQTITDIPDAWTEYVIDLSSYQGKNIYVAFNYTEKDKFYVMLDDIYIGPKQIAEESLTLRVQNYKIYLNGILKASQKNNRFVFDSLPVGSYVAGVEALYASGTSTRANYSFKVVPTGKEELDGKESFSCILYPNPVFDGSFLLKTSSAMRMVRIYSQDGKTLLQLDGKEQNQMQVNVSNLTSGLYFVEVQTEKASLLRKIIVK